LETTVAAIRQYVHQLIDENNRLKERSAQQAEQLETLQSQVGQLEARITEQAEKEQVLRMAQSLGGDEADNSSAKRRINELVREIDKCIALLNK
jgi:predicted  nucleic acid-binding Zn-ribbon protein